VPRDNPDCRPSGPEHDDRGSGYQHRELVHRELCEQEDLWPFSISVDWKMLGVKDT
jgi:hypothetical protein